MMTFLLISLSLSFYVLGVFMDVREMSLLAVQLFSAYVFCCLVDAFFALVYLKRKTSKQVSVRSAFYPLTWVGRQFTAYQEAISYRISSLSDQVEASSVKLEVKTPEPTADSPENYFEQLLNELEVSFSPTSCAVLIQDKDSEEPQVFLKGIRGKRIKEQLKNLFAAWFVTGTSDYLGSHDTLHHDFPTDELSGFGLRYIISSAFIRADKKVVLSLGFAADKEPSSLTLIRLDEYAKKLEKGLETFTSFQELKYRVDQAEEVSEARNEFLTHISHDIKSPLNNVKSILSLLKDELSESADNKKLLEAALKNCDSVAELVNSLVDFAKYRSGKLLADKSELDLGALVEEVARSFEASARAKGLSLSFTVPVDKADCFADKTQIRRILSNLLSNSIKYTQAGRVSIKLEESNQQNWMLRISDTGPGFSDDQLKEIFTPFTRFDTQGIEGVGLGLAVSKLLSELNGGSLEVRSVHSAGSEFIVSIPAASQKLKNQLAARGSNVIDFAKISQQAMQQKKVQRLGGLRLLLVDDDSDSTQALARILAKEGADIAQAINVPDAISIMNFDKIDVLITDEGMPLGGGRKLIKHARLNSPNMAVIVVTGDDSKAEELIALGAACVMDKPVLLSELIDYLEDVLRSNIKQRVIGE